MKECPFTTSNADDLASDAWQAGFKASTDTRLAPHEVDGLFAKAVRLRRAAKDTDASVDAAGTNEVIIRDLQDVEYTAGNLADEAVERLEESTGWHAVALGDCALEYGAHAARAREIIDWAVCDALNLDAHDAAEVLMYASGAMEQLVRLHEIIDDIERAEDNA